MPAGSPRSPLRERARRVLPPVVGLVLFTAALVVIHGEFRDESPAEVRAALGTVTPRALALAVGLAAVSYVVLTLYDAVALQATRADPRPYRDVARASFVSYALSYNLGFSLVTASSVRYRFYRGMGLSRGVIARVVAVVTLSAWMGWAAVAGVLLLAGVHAPALRGVGRVAGVLLLALVGAFVGGGAWMRRRWPVKWRAVAPEPRAAARQLGVASADWVLKAAVVAVLLPASVDFPFPRLLLAFLVAQVLGVASNVPGGLGVFEGTLLVLAPADTPRAALLAGLVAYRFVYYLLPLALAALVLAWHEVVTRRRGVGAPEWLVRVAPPALAALSFVAAALVLVTGSVTNPAWRPLPDVTDSPPLVSAIARVAAGLAAGALLAVAPRLAVGDDRARRDALTLATLLAPLVFLRDGSVDFALAPALAAVVLAPAAGVMTPQRTPALTARWMLLAGLVVAGATWLAVIARAGWPVPLEAAWRALAASPTTVPALTAVTAAAVILVVVEALRVVNARAHGG